MKKYLVALAAIAILFASCDKKTEGGDEYTSIKFKQTELELGLGETYKLTVLYEPTTLDAPKVTWTSSASDIVSVENGNIEALAIGEANITAKYGELSAVCHVKVLDPLDKVKWGGWTIWKLNKTDFQSPDTFTVRISTGEDTRCRVISGDFRIWDDGFIQETDDDGNFTGLSGAGYTMYIQGVPVFLIVEPAKYYGYYISYSTFEIIDPAKYNPADTACIYCAPAGEQHSAEAFYTYLTDTTATIDYADCFTGVEIDYIDFDEEKGYYWQGLAGTGIYGGDEWEAYYRCNINWLGGAYGLAINDEGTDFKKPAEWAPLTAKYYEKLPEASGEEVKGVGTPKLFVEKKAENIQIVRGLPTDVLVKK